MPPQGYQGGVSQSTSADAQLPVSFLKTVYKAGDYGPANSVGSQDLGARVWLKLSTFYF